MTGKDQKNVPPGRSLSRCVGETSGPASTTSTPVGSSLSFTAKGVPSSDTDPFCFRGFIFKSCKSTHERTHSTAKTPLILLVPKAVSAKKHIRQQYQAPHYQVLLSLWGRKYHANYLAVPYVSCLYSTVCLNIGGFYCGNNVSNNRFYLILTWG